MERRRQGRSIQTIVCSCTVSLFMLAFGITLVVTAAPLAAANPNSAWYTYDRILYRATVEPYDHYDVKDPAVVYSGSQYHILYTNAKAAAGGSFLLLMMRRSGK